MELSAFVVPLGIATGVSLLTTACFALFRRRNPRLLIKLHKSMAAVTVALAVAHATCVFFG